MLTQTFSLLFLVLLSLVLPSFLHISHTVTQALPFKVTRAFQLSYLHQFLQTPPRRFCQICLMTLLKLVFYRTWKHVPLGEAAYRPVPQTQEKMIPVSPPLLEMNPLYLNHSSASGCNNLSWTSIFSILKYKRSPKVWQGISAQPCCSSATAGWRTGKASQAQQTHPNTMSYPHNPKQGKRSHLGDNGHSCLPIKYIFSTTDWQQGQYIHEERKMLVSYSSGEYNSHPCLRLEVCAL